MLNIQQRNTATNPFQIGQDLRNSLNKERTGIAKGIYAMPTTIPRLAAGHDTFPRREGELEGPGTITSDEIPAMLSRKEAVLNAGAVEHVKDEFGDDIIKEWNAKYKPKGAETKVRGGIFRAAGGSTDLQDLINRNTGVGLKYNSSVPLSAASAAEQAATVSKADPTPGTDLVPASTRTSSGPELKVREGFFKTPAPETQGFTVEPSTNPGGTMQANRALTTYKGDPWTAGSTSRAGENLRAGIRGAYEGGKSAIKGIGKGLYNAATSPETFIPAAYEANKYLLNKGLQSGNPGYPEAARMAITGAVDNPRQLAESVAGPIGEGPLTKAFGKGVEALTPTPEIVEAAYKGKPIPNTPAGTSEADFKKAADAVRDTAPVKKAIPEQKSKASPAKGITPERNASGQAVIPTSTLLDAQGKPVVKAENWGSTGLRKDDAVQVLDWNENRFDNSGDAEQDAALQERRAARALHRSGVPTQVASGNNRPEYGVSNGVVYQQSGTGASEHNANVAQALEQNYRAAQEAKGQKESKPAFKEADIDFLIPDAPLVEKKRLSTMPKEVWDTLNDAIANSRDDAEASKWIAQLSEKAGVSPASIKQMLGMRQEAE